MHTLTYAFKAMDQGQTFEICRAAETINGLHQQIHFLQSYIADVGRQSEQDMLVYQQSAEFFERKTKAQRWSIHQCNQTRARGHHVTFLSE